MKHCPHPLIVLGLAFALLSPAHAQTPTELGLQAISDLAQVNGQALACQELSVANRAKSLMLAHAPKTARFGSVYEEGTQQSFIRQTNGTVVCPTAAAMLAQLDAIAQRLQTNLPAGSQ